MNCKKCGAALIEGAAFCGHCGGRVDGKKVCVGCGAEFEDKFCPYCGKSETENKGNLKTVADIIANAAMLLGAVFALIFVFFIGLKMQMEGEAEETLNIFYYFGEYAKEMEELHIQQMNTTPWFIQSIEGQLNIGGIIGLIFSLLILATTATFAIIAIVKYCVGWANGKHVNVEGWALASIISFLIGAVGFFAFNNVAFNGSASIVGGGVSGLTSTVEGRVKFDDLTSTAIVLCAICVIVSTVFRMIFAGKTLWTKENLGKQVFSFLLIVLSAALLGISQGALIELEVNAQTGNALVDANFFGFSSGFTIGIAGSFTEETASGYYAVTDSIAAINNFSVFAALFALALTAFSALSLMQNLRSVKGDNTAQNGKLWAILALVSAVLLLVCEIFVFVGVSDVAKTLSEASEDMLQGRFTVAILCVIFAVAVLVLTLVAEKKGRKEEPVS